ncbi:MAG: ribosome-associated translation inhibitor RaiA [Planctomycetes bacterium]|nr:ribosome-associated translation inhibitor RaiA [Planctomycetota bacterium]MCA8937151.1 ribosome-associated translation inhibitor RaiA [Planctomycetota bacterium]MCA8944752.1 ribosome-associated translation inhibitor RaiA [Planctomycetota bacterium]
MRITITAKHVKVTDKMKDYAREKLAKLERYFDRIANIQVILDKDGKDNVCEINISTETHNQVTAIVHNAEDMHAAVDLCVDKSHRQIKKIKEKLKGHKGNDKRKKLGRDVKKLTQRLPRETTYEEAKNE